MNTVSCMFNRTIVLHDGTVKLTGNVACRYPRVPQWNPCEAPMLRCPAQELRVTAWITASHASIFSRQQGHRKDQPAPRPAEHSSLHSIVASHLCTIFIRLPGACSSRGTSYHIFQLPQAVILKSAWTSAWTD